MATKTNAKRASKKSVGKGRSAQNSKKPARTTRGPYSGKLTGMKGLAVFIDLTKIAPIKLEQIEEFLAHPAVCDFVAGLKDPHDGKSKDEDKGHGKDKNKDKDKGKDDDKDDGKGKDEGDDER